MTDQLNLGHGDFESVDFDEHAVQVPMPLILDPQVPGEALATFTVMKSYGRRAEAAVASYAERLGWSTDTVKKWQKMLVKTKWLVLLREGKDSTPRLWWMAKSKGEQPPLGALLKAPQENFQGGKNSPPKQGLSSSSKVSSKQPQEQAFETWWSTYPNKGSKKTALKAWLKLNPDPQMTQTLMQDVALRARSEKWTKSNGDFVPLGATYLNGERWNDPEPTDVHAPFAPACVHPRATFKVQETYTNGSAYGICGTCGRPVTLPKESA